MLVLGGRVISSPGARAKPTFTTRAALARANPSAGGFSSPDWLEPLAPSEASTSGFRTAIARKTRDEHEHSGKQRQPEDATGPSSGPAAGAITLDEVVSRSTATSSCSRRESSAGVSSSRRRPPEAAEHTQRSVAEVAMTSTRKSLAAGGSNIMYPTSSQVSSGIRSRWRRSCRGGLGVCASGTRPTNFKRSPTHRATSASSLKPFTAPTARPLTPNMN